MSRLALVHPDRLFREALAAALGAAGLATVAAADALDRLDLGGEAPPDVLVLDLGLPERSGLAAARAARAALPGTRILMIGCSELERDVLAALEAGASGYVLQGASIDELVRCLRAVARGGAVCSPEVAGLVIGRLAEYSSHWRHVREGAAVRVTPREIEILRLVDGGLSNKEIARHLRIELQTVKNHVHNILDKLGVGRREEAVRFARRRGLLGPAQPAAGHAGALPRGAAGAAGAGY
jgi:DNA-binding NarL/FixJ family response regulator